MVPKHESHSRVKLSMATYMAIRSLAIKKSKAEFEDFLFKVFKEYMAETRGCDYIDEEDYLNIKDKTFECECPSCHEKLVLDLKELVK